MVNSPSIVQNRGLRAPVKQHVPNRIEIEFCLASSSVRVNGPTSHFETISRSEELSESDARDGGPCHSTGHGSSIAL